MAGNSTVPAALRSPEDAPRLIRPATSTRPARFHMTLRTFGGKGLFARGVLHYPRERLFNALPEPQALDAFNSNSYQRCRLVWIGRCLQKSLVQLWLTFAWRKKTRLQR